MQGVIFYLSRILSQKVTGGYAPPKQGRGKYRVHETCDTNEAQGIPRIDNEGWSQNESYVPRHFEIN